VHTAGPPYTLRRIPLIRFRSPLSGHPPNSAGPFIPSTYRNCALPRLHQYGRDSTSVPSRTMHSKELPSLRMSFPRTHNCIDNFLHHLPGFPKVLDPYGQPCKEVGHKYWPSEGSNRAHLPLTRALPLGSRCSSFLGVKL
jgi:hypothetical protein